MSLASQQEIPLTSSRLFVQVGTPVIVRDRPRVRKHTTQSVFYRPRWFPKAYSLLRVATAAFFSISSCCFVLFLFVDKCVRCVCVYVFLGTDVLSVMAPVAFSSSGTNNEESLHHSSADKEVAWHGQVRKKRICSELVLYLLLFFFFNISLSLSLHPFSSTMLGACVLAPLRDGVVFLTLRKKKKVRAKEDILWFAPLGWPPTGRALPLFCFFPFCVCVCPFVFSP